MRIRKTEEESFKNPLPYTEFLSQLLEQCMKDLPPQNMISGELS